MPEFSPEQLQVWTAGRWHGGVPARVTGWSNDTRALKPGDAFVALKTASRDGHDFLDDAAARGAGCALVAREVAGAPIPQLVVGDPLESLQRVAAIWREKFRGPVYGVTGSVGKTSTKDLLRRILGPDTTHATHANLNNLLGVPLTLLGLDPATHAAAVIEAGMSEPGELERSAWILRPDIAVVTNVQPAHLAGLGSMEAVAREKSALCRRPRRAVLRCSRRTASRTTPFGGCSGGVCPWFSATRRRRKNATASMTSCARRSRVRAPATL